MYIVQANVHKKTKRETYHSNFTTYEAAAAEIKTLAEEHGVYEKWKKPDLSDSLELASAPSPTPPAALQTIMEKNLSIYILYI